MKHLFLIPLILFLSACSRETEPTPRPPKKALHAVAELPVLYDGRVMPFDTFARLHLLQFSGRDAVGDVSAAEWMARLLFEPGTTEDDLVFLVEHPGVLEDMKVEIFQEIPGERKPSTRRFSFTHLEPGVLQLEDLARQAQALEEDDRDLVQKEALRVYMNILTYRALNQVFSYARVLDGLVLDDPELRAALDIPDEMTTYTFIDLKDRADALSALMKEVRSESDPNNWTDTQKSAFALARMMFTFRNNFSELPFYMLPEAPHGQDKWVSPLDALHNPDGDENLIEAAHKAGELAEQWRARDWDAVVETSEWISDFSRARMDHNRDVGLTGREARFNRGDYFGKAKFWYILGFFLATGALVSGNALLRKAAWFPVGLALFLHVVGLGWRIFLTARPPVTNLYGTFLFVGLICVGLALLVEVLQKNALGLFAGTFIALSFLFVADRFAAEGDTLNKVVAVLASNFWLSTHVLAVTTGYAGVWIAGVFGHIWLVLKVLGKPKELLNSVKLPMEGLLGFGLTFAFLGTMLGGVWADQSWGRFWGWDPKENGALLIVLWTAVIYHAQVGGMIRDIGMAAGTVIGCVMVILAWLGINLLGVGLHSYGFTDSMYNGFISYILFETVFLGVTLGALAVKGEITIRKPTLPKPPSLPKMPKRETSGSAEVEEVESLGASKDIKNL